ncbi:hypothetical protein HBH70_195420 [Parastagonospora nodorum]|nr:hypothetical protein HBH53_186160 [Parastagonospora nodorum]KAH3993424.1 hypothetical protein HBI10_203280 [Parastagonospora nodorum]KAH4011649.1 hypothetical protein HBI13_194980 [Parastagonospora nodorum]KAH4256477.1 hypothetical protein HBI03_163220 [Parastagonospora nodorum]KAH4269663.1 hypothetical protein HBI04_158220 [Parastagonospora nodorum]
MTSLLFRWWTGLRALLNTRSDYIPLCQRCERLELLASVNEMPHSDNKYRGPLLARIDNIPIDTSCVLCARLGQYLQHLVSETSSQLVGKTRSVELLQYQHFQYGTYFAIQYCVPGRELRIFLVEPAILLGFLEASITHPFTSFTCQNSSGGMATGRLCDPASVDTNTLREWYEQCNSNHKHACGKVNQDGMRPDRLIDCRLRELCDSDEPYVCLSYVWGSILSDQDSASCTLPQKLPATISDAMEVTLRIGMRYLWVDRYCIDQDNEVEKHNIIRNMDAIYGGAELTIIAAAGHGPGYGLPGLSRTREPQRTLKIGKRVFVAVENPVIEIVSSEWNSRAWTYQEALLSRRRLVFTDRQVYFQCCLGHRMEGVQLPNFMELPLKTRAFPESGIGIRAVEIYDRLEEYYARKLSFDIDILNALSGIFRAFQRRPFGSGSPYALHFYGIPIITSTIGPLGLANPHVPFAAGLAWRVVGCGQEATISSTARISSNYPSWTWASLKAQRPKEDPGELSFLYRDSSRLPWLDEIVRICFHHQSGAQMSLVDYVKHDCDYTAFSPRIYVTSMTCSGKLLRSSSDRATFVPCPAMTVHLDQTPSIATRDTVAVYIGYMKKGSRVFMAFLLVELLDSGHCRRLGILSDHLLDDMYRFDHEISNNPLTDPGLYFRDICGGGEWHEKSLVLE